MEQQKFLTILEDFSMDNLLGSNVTFVNPFSWLEISRGIESSELDKFKIFADGIGVVLLYNLFLRTKLKRFSFDYTSIAPKVFDYAQNRGLKVFLIGGGPYVAKEASMHFLSDFPKLSIIGIESGYFNTFNSRKKTLSDAANADIVIVGMGVPHQENFLIDLRSTGWAGTGFTCGGFFDQAARKGNVYYPKIINRLNLRWLYRLWEEPRRLSKRYLLIYPKFLFIFFTLCIQRIFRKGQD